jgi:competence protein ComEA
VPELPPPPSLDGGDPSALPSLAAAGAVRDALGQLRTSLAGDGAALAGAARRFAAVLAVAVVGAVAWAAYARGASGSAPPPELTMPRASAASTMPADAATAGDRASPTSVFVHVAGAVTRPGLYRLGGSPRVADAIDAAGGVAPSADLDGVNLAASVADGERVYVPRAGELPPSVAGADAGATATGPLDLNTATAEQLDTLPGIGPATADAIVSYRTEHGRFRSVEELLEVRGIGQAKLDELRDKVRVR